MKVRLFFSQHRLLFYKIFFWGTLIFTAAPLLLFPLQKKYYQRLHSLPAIENGVLDLEGFAFNKISDIPLNGTWEFYWNKWLVTDSEANAVPDAMVSVPGAWSHYDFDGGRLPNDGYASYRLLLNNCPDNMRISCYIPNLGAAYRIFLNGELISQSGVPSKDARNTDVSFSLDRDPFPPSLTADSELVIEISACHIGGLYIAPLFVRHETDIQDAKIYTILIAMCVGMFLLILFCCFYILSLKDLTPQFFLLAFMSLIILLRMLGKDELYRILELPFPWFRSHTNMNILRTITFFLPAAFIFWANSTMDLHINTKLVKVLVLMDALFCVPLLWYFMNGYMAHYAWLYGFCLFPYVFVLIPLYRQVKMSTTYSFTVSASFMLMLSSMVMTSLHSAGEVRPHLSLYAPIGFVLALFLQASIYFRKDKELQLQALEYTKLKLTLQEKETTLMLSQIKPHFLYNALIAIQVLCMKNPVEASDAIGQFSQYLRANMQSINNSEPVSFSQELNHIENYAAIEKLRFKDRLHIVYDIQSKDFKIPVLTIQPLVENAIKHGVCHKIAGGTVTLRTYEDSEFYYIEVLDDGVGFCTDELSRANGYGIKNISYRLKEKMGAAIDIKSCPDEGTIAQIKLPKGGQNLECDNN